MVDSARLERAHIEAFDGAGRDTLKPQDLAVPDPDLRLAVQFSFGGGASIASAITQAFADCHWTPEKILASIER